jgi:hypothetical protein
MVVILIEFETLLLIICANYCATDFHLITTDKLKAEIYQVTLK